MKCKFLRKMKPLINGGWRGGKMVVSWVARWRSWNMQWFARAPRLLITSGLLPLNWPVKNWKFQFPTFSLSQVKFDTIFTQTKCCSRTREMQIAQASLFIAHPSLGNHFIFSLNTGTFWSRALWRVFTGCPKKALFKKLKFWTVLGDHGPFWIVTKVLSKMIVIVQNCPWSSKQSKTWNFWKVLFQPLVNLEDCE